MRTWAKKEQGELGCYFHPRKNAGWYLDLDWEARRALQRENIPLCSECLPAYSSAPDDGKSAAKSIQLGLRALVPWPGDVACAVAKGLGHLASAPMRPPLVRTLDIALAWELAVTDAEPTKSPWHDFQLRVSKPFFWLAALKIAGADGVSIVWLETPTGVRIDAADLWPTAARVALNIARGACNVAASEHERRLEATQVRCVRERHLEATPSRSVASPIVVRAAIEEWVTLLMLGMGKEPEHVQGAPHRRRGHWLNAACGAGRSERRKVWRRPTVVRGRGKPKGSEYDIR
jgi:hypothetical protein